MFARFKELLKDGLSTRSTVVEEDIKRNKGIDMPGREDLQKLSPGIRLPLLSAFALHAFLSEYDFLLGQVEGLGDLREVGQREETEKGNG